MRILKLSQLSFNKPSAAMTVRFHTDADAFERLALPFLLESEAENNLMVGLIRQIAEGAFEHFWLASIQNEGEVVGCAIQTPPHWVLLTPAPATGVAALAAELVRRVPKVAGVIGPVSACDIFAETWCWETHASASVRLSQGVYQLDEVIPPARPAPGYMRVIRAADLDQVATWHAAFLEETGIVDARDGHDVARQHLEAQTLFLWEDDGRAVSMAAFAGPTPHGIRVNFVYTPTECRGHGYASSCVAELSQKLLDGGREFCFLYTDQENPTSNAIYQAIGYRKVAESVVLEFDYA